MHLCLFMFKDYDAYVDQYNFDKSSSAVAAGTYKFNPL